MPKIDYVICERPLRERSHMTSARFYPPLSALSDPLMTSAFARPPISKRHKFFKEPPTLIETLNVYLIQLKTESLGEYINAVVSRIVIGPLDLKQFLLTSARLRPLPPPCQHFETPSAADVICERSLSKCNI